jgi:hypothetical protein
MTLCTAVTAHCAIQSSDMSRCTVTTLRLDWLTGQPWFDSRHGQVSNFPRNIDTCSGTHISSDLWVLAGVCRRLNELRPVDDISPFLVSRFIMSRTTLFVTQQPKPGRDRFVLGFLVTLTHTHKHTHTHTDTHTNTPERVIGPSQSPLPTQHTTNAVDEHSCPERKSDPNDRLQANSFDRSVTGISGLYFYSLHTQALRTRGQIGLLDFLRL